MRLKENRTARKYLGLVSFIPSLPKMFNLDIPRYTLDGNNDVVASDIFRGLPTLTELDMSYNQIGMIGVATIFSIY